MKTLMRLPARLERRARWWGTTENDRALPFPCDSFVREPHVNSYRAIAIDAPAELVYRWMCQLQIAPYSYDWIDNYGRRSPRRLIAGADQLKIGQPFLRIFDLVDYEPASHITIRIARQRWFWGPDVGTSYLLVPQGASSCRLVVDVVAYASPGILGQLRRKLFPWGELLMMKKQLRTIKQLAEGQFLAEGRSTVTPSSAPVAPRENGKLPTSVVHLAEGAERRDA